MKKTFYRPKLEAGVNATPWQPCSTYTSSLIRQTSNSIMLEVEQIVSGATEHLYEDIATLSGDVRTTEVTVSGHTQQIGQLVLTTQSLSGQVGSISSEITHVEMDIATLSGDVRSTEVTVSGHTQQIGELVLTTQGLGVTVGQIEDKITTANGDIASLSGDVTTISGEISGITSDITTIHSDIQNINEEIAVITGDVTVISGITASINALSGTVQTHTEQIGELTVSTGEISGQVSNISDRVTALANDTGTLSATTEQHTAQIGNINVSLNAISGTVVSYDSRITSIADDVNTVSATTATNTQRIGELSLSVSGISGSVSDIQDNVTTITDQISTLSGDVTTVTGSIEDLTGDIADINIDIASISGDVITVQTTVSGHTSQIGELSVTTQAIEGRVSNVEEGYSAVTISIEDIEGDIETISGSVTTHTSQIGQLTVNTTAISGTVESVESNVTTLSNSIDDTNTVVSGHTTQIGNLTIQADNISLGLTSVSGQVETVNGEIVSMSNDIKKTGIDIEQGKITLKADNTVIDGNLNIQNANEGLVIYDNATDTPKIAIQGDTLGNLTSSTFAVNNQYAPVNTFSNTTCTFSTIPLGQVNAGNTIQVTDCTIFRPVDKQEGLGNISYSLVLKKDGTTVNTYTGTATWNQTYSEYSFSLSTFTVTSGGQYTISLTITSNENLNGVQAVAYVSTTVTTSTLVKLAKDGAVFASTQDNYTWFGSDQTRLKWGNSFMNLNTDGIMYRTKTQDVYDQHLYEPGEIGSTTKLTSITTGNSYAAQLTEGMIVLRNGISSPFTLTLPQPERCGGKYYFIKNKSGIYGGTYVNATVTCVNSTTLNPLIMDNNSNSLDEYRNLQNDSTMMFCDGEHWIIFSSQY